MTLKPVVRLLAEAVEGLMIEVELEKNTISELPLGSWSVMVCPLIDAIFPMAKLPLVRLPDAPRDDAPKFPPFGPPANCRDAEDPIFPTKRPNENASITATAQMICILYFLMNDIRFLLLLFIFDFISDLFLDLSLLPSSLDRLGINSGEGPCFLKAEARTIRLRGR